jgi:adenosylcobinamide hydrolase
LSVVPFVRELDRPDTRAALVWVWPHAVPILTSAAVAGGLVRSRSLVNVGVTGDYCRTDLVEHASEVHAQVGVAVVGPTLFTAADITKGVVGLDGDVRCDATVGVTRPTWAADTEDSYAAWSPGTVNMVVQVPIGLSDAAMVNAVITATEAKTQAFREAAIPGTGTASDAVAIVGAHDGPVESFAGPRSYWGARIARAVHTAVAIGIATHP